ncbi:MAG: efflux RND transporter permease subunit [Nitrospinae bacterium]|nr:efflux RND transporter permease subunit [Nitrospinota bacterium]
MLNRIIELSVKNRLMVFLTFAFVAAAGWFALTTMPLDALPDLSDTQVIIFTEFEGQAPQIVEDQLTYPLTTAMLSVPYAKVVRGYSFFNMSFVYVIFEDGTDLYWARSRVMERLATLSGRLPAGVSPTIGPDATGVGWVYEYALVDKTGGHDLSQLRTLQDWYLKYELQKVPGVSEVASVGGFVRQYQVEVDPNKLAAYHIPIGMVGDAIRRSNADVGGRSVEMAEREYVIRGRGYIKGVGDVEDTVVTAPKDGVPIRVKDVATVHLGPELRRGIAELNGEGEVAGGVILSRQGGNALDTITRVKARLEELKSGLPKGVEIVPVYDRSDLIHRAIEFLKGKLFEEFLVVAAVCVVFLFHLRSSLVAILSIPVGAVMAFIVMRLQGINANIMSLGGVAIAIGAMVDGAVVMIENTHKHLEHNVAGKPHEQVVLEAVSEVGPPLFFALLIITASFLPVFTLQAQEGRLFSPLAFTKTYSMAAAALLAVTLVPAMMVILVKGKITPEARNPINVFLSAVYGPLIRFALRWKWTVLAAFAAFLVLTVIPLKRLGSEFLPPLYEGDILYMPSAYPGISVTKAREFLQRSDGLIKSFPEVERVFGKQGRAETATDPAMLPMTETTIMLRPRDRWRPGMTVEKLTAEMDAALKFPGVTNVWTLPIRNRIDMLSTGIKTPVGIKVAGPDLATIGASALRIEEILKNVPHTASVFAERVSAGSYLDITVDRAAAARYGLKVGDVQDVISSALGGMAVSQTVEGRERYSINVRFKREFREDVEGIKRTLVPLPQGGGAVPLSQLADIRFSSGPSEIKSENARLNAWVYVDIRDIDVGTYVKTAKERIAREFSIPPGVSLVWSGQYEYMERAAERIKLVVPLTLLIIFVLLYLNFRTFTEIFIVMSGIPLATAGSVWLLWILGYNLSVAVGVGLIALSGLAVEIFILNVMYIGHAVEEGRREGRMNTRADLTDAIIKGCLGRLRPKAMTNAAIIGGLLPIMWGTGAGSEVMKRIAAPMVGGILSTTIVGFFFVPVVYALIKRREYK